MTTNKGRLDDVDVAKGIAIVLVVFGHLVARDIKPAGNEWYALMHEGLYSFHMAFFFYLAGYVFWTAEPSQRVIRVRRAASRMVPAYLIFAVCAFPAKLGLASFVPVDRPVRSVWSDWLGLLIYPTEGFISYLWFIVALLGIYGFTLVALRYMENAFAWIASLALALHFLSVLGYVTKIGALHQVARYWVFFLVAHWALQYRHAVLAWVLKWWVLCLAALLLALCYLPTKVQWVVAAFLSLPALHGMAVFIATKWPGPSLWLRWLGERSWPIYLMNTFAIGAAKVLVLKTLGWDGARFFIAIPLLLSAGLLLPILVQRKLLSRNAWLDRITR